MHLAGSWGSSEGLVGVWWTSGRVPDEQRRFGRGLLGVCYGLGFPPQSPPLDQFGFRVSWCSLLIINC